jgi:hypothetical protein
VGATTLTSAFVRLGSVRMESGARLLFRRWVVANGWAETVGLGTTLVLAWTLAPWFGRDASATAIVAAAAAATLLGTLLEGVVVGTAQERVLRQYLPEMSPRSWVVRTAMGTGAAWLLGMVPSVVAALVTTEGARVASSEPPRVVQYVLAMALGVALGALLGGAQWTILRRHTVRAGAWIWANAAAWGVGMPCVFVGMDLVPWSGGPALVAVSIYAVALITGLLVGSIHGCALVGLMADSNRSRPVFDRPHESIGVTNGR